MYSTCHIESLFHQPHGSRPFNDVKRLGFLGLRYASKMIINFGLDSDELMKRIREEKYRTLTLTYKELIKTFRNE